MNMLYVEWIGTINVKNASMGHRSNGCSSVGRSKGKGRILNVYSDTFNPLSQKLENENVELGVSGLPKIDETHALSDPFKNSREEKFVPNKPIKAIVRTKPITVSQPHVLTKKFVNSNSHGLSSIGVDNPAKIRRPQPRSNTKNDKVPSTSKSSCSKNKEVEVEEHPRNLLLSKNKKHMSSKCNNVKLAIRNDKSKVVCAMCKQSLITANHDVCILNYVNGINSCDRKQKENVLNIANQTKHKPRVKKPKKVGSTKRLASPKPSDVFQKL
ncbi:hypothetical protein Tco_0692970 [Tanacetum coccineum]